MGDRKKRVWEGKNSLLGQMKVGAYEKIICLPNSRVNWSKEDL